MTDVADIVEIGLGSDSKFLTLDERHRVSLGHLARYKYYFAKCEEDGTIILTPAVVVRVGKGTNGGE